MASNPFNSPNEAAHDLLRHVAPSDVESRMYDIIRLNESLTDDLLLTVDTPLKTMVGPNDEREYIKCDYNRDGDSYRSPYTNKYFPSIEDAVYPSPMLRQIEELAITGFQTYLRHYYETGLLNVYAWDIDDGVFGVGVFVTKELDKSLRDQTPFCGTVSCSDVIEVTQMAENGQFQYSLISSILLSCCIRTSQNQPLALSGSCNDQKVIVCHAASPKDHLVNIGTMIEENARIFMDKVTNIYIGKMKEILSYTKGAPNDQGAQKLVADGMKDVSKDK